MYVDAVPREKWKKVQLPVDRTLQANIHYMFDGQNLGVLPIGGCHQSIDRDLDDII